MCTIAIHLDENDTNRTVTSNMAGKTDLSLSGICFRSELLSTIDFFCLKDLKRMFISISCLVEDKWNKTLS